MSEKQNSHDSEKAKDQSKVPTFREWFSSSAIAATVTALIGLLSGIIQILAAFQPLTPALVGIISGILSMGIVLYTIWFRYQIQQKRKKQVEDALRRQEQEFLTQINLGFSILLEEKGK